MMSDDSRTLQFRQIEQISNFNGASNDFTPRGFFKKVRAYPGLVQMYYWGSDFAMMISYFSRAIQHLNLV